jgi:hypothetical protein
MGAPCPVESPGPWSPLGYRVVEVAEETVPDAKEREALEEQACRWLNDAPPDQEAEAPAEVPSPSLRYRAVEVAEKGSRARAPQGPPGRRRPRLAFWSALAGCCACGLASVLVLSFALPSSRPGPPPPPPVASAQPQQATPALPACAVPDDRVVRRLTERGETFGTAVMFVRTPAVAARIADEEGKLTFLLHVSGNFEEARFT